MMQWWYRKKNNLKWGIKNIIGWVGLRFLWYGRRMLRWSLYRCSWCGANCGLSSAINSKGLRCFSLDRKCTNMPYGDGIYRKMGIIEPQSYFYQD